MIPLNASKLLRISVSCVHKKILGCLTAGHIDAWHGAGNATFTPTTVADVQPVYQRTVGAVRLDLTQIPDSDGSGAIHTSVNLGAGNVTVLVPTGADVVATCSARVGNVDCLGERSSGANNPVVRATQNNDGSGHLQIFLNVQDGAGAVRVTNNASSVPVPPTAPAPPTK